MAWYGVVLFPWCALPLAYLNDQWIGPTFPDHMSTWSFEKAAIKLPSMGLS